MPTSLKVRDLRAREVLDSRGFPTVEVELFLDANSGRAIVPSGASTGEAEAIELRDGDKRRFLGKGVLKAVANVREKIAPVVINREFVSQALFDEVLIDLDGSSNKSNLGANAILPVSMAFARAYAEHAGQALYVSLAELLGEPPSVLPVPLMNVINGGKHAENGLDIQEFMIVPHGFKKFSDALRAGAEIFHILKKILHGKGLSVGVGDEGGFAPVFQGEKPHEQALSALVQAITDAGYTPGTEVSLALDCAASEFATGDKEAYRFEGRLYSARELSTLYMDWLREYHIISIEDPLAEHDWQGWKALTQSLSEKCQLVGDDLFVTNPEFLKRGIEKNVANSVLIKLNQIGTVSETLKTISMALEHHYSAIISHRSGETEDTFIADLAVASNAGQIKTGSLSRTDRTAKYNQLLRIEEALGGNSKFAGSSIFNRKRV